MRTLIAIAAAALLAGCAVNVDTTTTGSVLPDSAVKIVLANGHGSGTVIGDGYVLTAAHVAEGNETVKLKLSDNSISTAEVLWVNKKYDVALLRTKAKTKASHLKCAGVKVGDTIKLAGNPIDIEFVTSAGKVVGGDRKWGPWEDVQIVDATVVPGMSGGGALDKNGNVVGITAGVQVAAVGFGASLTGFGAIVPSSAVCGLMGRG